MTKDISVIFHKHSIAEFSNRFKRIFFSINASIFWNYTYFTDKHRRKISHFFILYVSFRFFFSQLLVPLQYRVCMFFKNIGFFLDATVSKHLFACKKQISYKCTFPFLETADTGFFIFSIHHFQSACVYFLKLNQEYGEMENEIFKSVFFFSLVFSEEAKIFLTATHVQTY